MSRDRWLQRWEKRQVESLQRNGLTEAEVHELATYNSNKDKLVYRQEYEARMAELQKRFDRATRSGQ